MTDLTDHAKNLLARALCGRLPSLPSSTFAALGTGGADATGVTGEPAGNGYARQRVTFTGTGPQRNLSAVSFTFNTAAGTLSHLGLFDAATGGNPLTWAPLSAPVTVAGPGTVTVAADALTVTPEQALARTEDTAAAAWHAIEKASRRGWVRDPAHGRIELLRRDALTEPTNGIAET